MARDDVADLVGALDRYATGAGASAEQVVCDEALPHDMVGERVAPGDDAEILLTQD